MDALINNTRKGEVFSKRIFLSNVPNNEDIASPNRPFVRQLLIISVLWLTYFTSGLSFGASTVVIPQIRKEVNSTISAELASWITAAPNYSAIVWVVILGIVTEYVGRKPTLMVACVASVSNFAIFIFAKSPTQFLICQILQGVMIASNLTITLMLVTEYSSPQYRGLFLSIKCANIFWGMWVSNAIGTFFHWHYIGLVGLLSSVPYLSMFVWPESPYWLASKGRFEEATKAFRWIKGYDSSANEELEKILASQKVYLARNVKVGNIVKEYTAALKYKEFYKPILISITIVAQYSATGKFAFSLCALDLMKKITNNESTAYTSMLILDGVTVLGMYFGSYLSKLYNRRSLLVTSSCIAIALMFLMYLYLLLVNKSVFNENNVISVTFLALIFLAQCCGPLILSTCLYGELVPIRFKSITLMLINLVHSFLLGTSVKLSPSLFRCLNIYGTLFIFAVMSSIFTYLLYKYLPETKDKTLLEIEESFKDKSKTEVTAENLISIRNRV